MENLIAATAIQITKELSIENQIAIFFGTAWNNVNLCVCAIISSTKNFNHEKQTTRLTGIERLFSIALKDISKLNKIKKFLIALLLTNLLCTFFGGHGGAPLGLVELMTLYSAITFNFKEFPFFSFWTLATAFMLAGQVIMLLGLWKTNLLDTIRLGRLGTILLILPLIVIATAMSGHLLTATLITSLPFLVLTIAFWWTTIKLHNKQLVNGT